MKFQNQAEIPKLEIVKQGYPDQKIRGPAEKDFVNWIFSFFIDRDTFHSMTFLQYDRN